MILKPEDIDTFKALVTSKSYSDTIRINTVTGEESGEFLFKDANAAQTAQTWLRDTMLLETERTEDGSGYQKLTVKKSAGRFFTALAKAGVEEALRPYLLARFAEYDRATTAHPDTLKIDCDLLGDYQVKIAQDIALGQSVGLLEKGPLEGRGASLYITDIKLLGSLRDLGVAKAADALQQGVSQRAHAATHSVGAAQGVQAPTIVHGSGGTITEILAQVDAAKGRAKAGGG